MLPFPVLEDGASHVDAARNAAWDRLLALADHAWRRRDPDGLSELAHYLLQLSRDVAREWNAPEPG